MALISHEQRPSHIFICTQMCNDHVNSLISSSVCLHLWKKKKVCFEWSIFLKASRDTMNIVFAFDRRFGGKQAREIRVKSEMISTLLILLPQLVVLMQTSDSPGQRSRVEIWHYKCHGLMWYRSGCSSLEGKQISLVITSRGRQNKLISMFSLWKIFSWMNFWTQFWRSGEPQDSHPNPNTLKTVSSFPVAKKRQKKKKRFSSSAFFFFLRLLWNTSLKRKTYICLDGPLKRNQRGIEWWDGGGGI